VRKINCQKYEGGTDSAFPRSGKLSRVDHAHAAGVQT